MHNRLILPLFLGVFLAFSGLFSPFVQARDTSETAAQDYFRIKLPKQVELVLPQTAPTPKLQAAFDSLTPIEKISFYSKRQKFLSIVAKALAGPRLTGAVFSGAAGLLSDGTHSVVRPDLWLVPAVKPFVKLGKKVVNWFMPPAEYLAAETPEAAEVAAEMALAEELPLPAELRFAPSEPEILPAGKLSARGVEAIRTVLLMLDQNLWQDAKPLAGATHYNGTVIVGPSGGLGLRGNGILVMGGLEIEAGYEFATGKFYTDIHPVSQHLTHAGAIFEAHIVVGFLLKFTKRESGKLAGDGVDHAVTFPPLFAYRSSANMLGFGAYGGINLLALPCVYLGATHDLTLGGVLWAVVHGATALSTYWTDYQTYDKITWKRVKNWASGIFNSSPEERSFAAALELAAANLDARNEQLQKLAGFTGPDCIELLKTK